MALKEEIEAKILEHSMQHQENAVKSFSRDLKIAAVIILIFQFGIFFRFIGLYDQSMLLNGRIEQLHKGDEILGKIQIQLQSLKETFEPLERQLKEAPSIMRAGIKEFEIFIKELKQDLPPIHSMIQEPMQADLNTSKFDGPAFIRSLSDDEINILKNSDPRSEKYNDLIKRIVNKGIVQPTFEALNKQKEQLLEKEFEKKKSALLATLQSNLSTLNVFDQGLGEFEVKIHQVHDNLKAHRIKAPGSSIWWLSFRGKMRVFGTQSVKLKKIAGELDKPEQALKAFSQKLTGLIRQAENKQQILNIEMEKLKDNYNEVEELLKKYSKPLSVIAVEPRDAVLYYPIIVLGLFTYFFWRLMGIQYRGRSLKSVYKNHGLPDRYANLLFSGFPWLMDGRAKIKSFGWHHPQGISLVLLGIIPGILVAISLYWIVNSTGLSKLAPVFFYIVVAACFVVSFIISIMRFYRPKADP